jgi:peptidoglycan/xylan/chitin deacetylase (PgdA/CDA1 family)
MKFLRRSAVVLSFVSLFALSALTLFVFGTRDKYVVPILMYHQVAMLGSSPVGDLNFVSPKAFAHHMDFLRDNGYHVLSLSDLVEGMQKSRMFTRKTVVITFDDGYEDNYTNAFPILLKHEFPATVFVISDAVGTPGFATWEQLKIMDQAGFTTGSHTRHHPYLPNLKNDAQLEDEIINSRKILEKNFGKPIEYFSYPSGGFSEHIKSIVKKAGYKSACTTNRGYDRFNLDVYQLNRIRLNDDDNDLVLFAKLSGYYNLFRKCKSSH